MGGWRGTEINQKQSSTACLSLRCCWHRHHMTRVKERAAPAHRSPCDSLACTIWKALRGVLLWDVERKKLLHKLNTMICHAVRMTLQAHLSKDGIHKGRLPAHRSPYESLACAGQALLCAPPATDACAPHYSWFRWLVQVAAAPAVVIKFEHQKMGGPDCSICTHEHCPAASLAAAAADLSTRLVTSW